MIIEILIFGGAALVAKSDRVEVTVSDAPTVGELTSAFRLQHPALSFALASPRMAVNHVFADPATPLRAGDEVALITLVGGG